MVGICWCFKYVGLLVPWCLSMMFSTMMATPICPTDYYYDVVTLSCGHCSDICVAAEIKRTEFDCKRLCPDYSETTSEPATTAIPTIPSDTGLGVTDIVLIIVGSILSICAVVLLTLFIWQQRCVHTQQQANNELDNGCCECMLHAKKRQPTAEDQHEHIPLSEQEQTNEENGQRVYQPQEDDANAKRLVSGAASSNPLEPQETDKQTYLKEVGGAQAQD